MTVYLVILVEYGAVDGDNVRAFGSYDDAVHNFWDVAHQIRELEPDTYSVEIADCLACSEHYCVLFMTKSIE